MVWLFNFAEPCSSVLNKQRWPHWAHCWVWPGVLCCWWQGGDCGMGADSVDLVFQATLQVKLYLCFFSRLADTNSSCFMRWHNSDYIFSLCSSQYFSYPMGSSTRYFINVIVLLYTLRPYFLGGLTTRAVTFCNCSAHLFPNTSVWNYLFFPVRRL